MNRKFYLHIGLPKTGTTTLQVQHFPNYYNVRYLGNFEHNMGILGFKFKPNGLSRFYKYCIYGIGDELNAYEEFQFYLKNTEKKNYKNINNKLPILVSEECFISRFFNPIYTLKKYGYIRPELPMFLNRLNKFFKVYNYDLHILFVERNLKDLLLSMYLEYNWDIPSNINSFFKELQNSKEMQSAYSLDLMNSKTWQKEFTKLNVNFDTFHFPDIFKNKLFENFFKEKKSLAILSKALNTSQTKKKIKPKSLFSTFFFSLKIVYLSLKQLYKDLKFELQHNTRNKQFQKQYQQLKSDKDFEKNIIKLINENETT